MRNTLALIGLKVCDLVFEKVGINARRQKKELFRNVPIYYFY